MSPVSVRRFTPLLKNSFVGAGYVHVGIFEAGEEVAFADQFVGGCFVFLQVVLEGLVQARDRVAGVAGLHRHGGVRRERDIAAREPSEGKFGASCGGAQVPGREGRQGYCRQGRQHGAFGEVVVVGVHRGRQAPNR